MSSNPSNGDLRDTGIHALGAIPWGSHGCQLYESRKDLLDILIPFFRAGLEHNEACLWIVTEPLNTAEVASALQRAVPDLDRHLSERRLELLAPPDGAATADHLQALQQTAPELAAHFDSGAIGVIPPEQWYLKGGALDPARLVGSWREKLEQALARGFAGLRVHGTEAWLKEGNWSGFMEYERRLDEMLAGLRMIVLCTYPLRRVGGSEIFDVAQAHQFALAKRRGHWQVLETPELQETKRDLRALSDELDRRVQEKTRELTAANARLHETVALLEDQARVLEMVACEKPLRETLAALIREIQDHAPGMVASILLLDEEGVHLRHCVAPDLPPEYVQAIDGSAIGPAAGSCGTAAWRREPVIVEDIATDPLWERYRQFALPHGLRACWSTPIVSPETGVLGTFAMYYREPERPRPEHQRLVEVATHLSMVAIGHHRDRSALRQGEAKLNEAQRLAQLGYWERDIVHDRITLSPETASMFGVTPGAALSQAELQALIHPEDRLLQQQTLEEALRAGGKPYDLEYRVLLPQDRVRYVHVWDKMERDASGRAVRMFGTVQDVTERKRVETALRESHQLMELVLATLPVGVMVTDRAGDFVLINDSARRIWGGAIYSGQERWAQTKAYWHDSGKRLAPEEWGSARALAAGETSLNELIDIETYDGQRKTMRNSAAPIRKHGAIVGAVIVNEDVTERVQAQRRLLALAENLPDVVARFDTEGRCLYVNKALEKLTGVAPAAVIGQPALDRLAARLLPGASESWPRHRGVIERVFATGEPQDFALSLPFPAGERVINVRLIPERDEDGAIRTVLAIGRDITERARALEALRESEHRFREVTESIGEVFWLKDSATYELIYVSPAYETVWGRSRESLYRENKSWLHSVHPDDFERVESAAGQLDAPYDLEYRIIRPDGAVRWIHDRAFVVRDSEGKVYRISGVADDITRHRQMEQQLRESQKMEAVGRLAGGIAHDFNNMLAVIQMNTSLLLDTDFNSRLGRECLQDIMAAAERAGNLTRQLLTFSRRELKQAKNLDLGEVIDAMIKLLRRTLGEDVALETRFAASLPAVHADPGMIEQIIMNLAINARDAMPGGGRLSVALDAAPVGEERAAAHPGVAPGAFVCLTVSDTGAGIPPENLTRVFEPFFTTKEVGKGTGLGLATVFGIVEQHRGWIEVESEMGRGTSFRVFLPATAPGAAAADEASQPKPCAGHETILLVEDEDPLRAIACVVLEQHGYLVFQASTAAAATEIWEKERARIDLLLTDLIMPGGTSGRQLAERLQAEKPALEVIYTSGYSEDLVSQHLHLERGRTFLQKPYSSVGLLEIVRRRLDEARA